MQPPALHIFSPRTFSSLYIVPSSSLVTFAHPSPSSATETNTTVLQTNLDELNNNPHSHHPTAIPQPIFTLSNRLLAYVSPPPRLDSPHEVLTRTVRSASHGASDDNTLKFPLTQAELGVAASKLGVSVLSGMKVLGGMAFSAARAGVTAAATAAERRYSAEVNANPVVPGKFFSRSAPAASGRDEQHDTPHAGDTVQDNASALDASVVDRQSPTDDTHHITVVDLDSIRSSLTATPTPRCRVLRWKGAAYQPAPVLTRRGLTHGCHQRRPDHEGLAASTVSNLRTTPGQRLSC